MACELVVLVLVLIGTYHLSYLASDLPTAGYPDYSPTNCRFAICLTSIRIVEEQGDLDDIN
jgi:hypothetical protein